MVEPVQLLVRHASLLLRKTLTENSKLKEQQSDLEEWLRQSTENCQRLEFKLKSFEEVKSNSDPLKKLQEHNNLLTLKNLKLQT